MTVTNPDGTTSVQNTTVSTAQGAYNNAVVSGAVTLITGDLSLSAIYTYGPGSSWATNNTSGEPCPNPGQTATSTRMDAGWCVRTTDMHAAVLDVGQQGVGERHAWRVGLGVGWEFASGSLLTQLGYRSTIRLVAGLFVAIDVRGMFLLRLVPNNPQEASSLGARELAQVPMGFDRASTTMAGAVGAASPPYGFGGQALVSLGYSIH
jgi:hypothetical protein